MPESVTDRPTKSHEQIFLLSKSGTYFYNETEAKEPSIWDASGNVERKYGADVGCPSDNGKHQGRSVPWRGTDRNWRTVWTIGPEPNNAQHYAPFPREVARRCIVAGSRVGDMVLDPFCGTGTTVRVADGLGRKALGFDLGEKYVAQANERLGTVRPADARSGQQIGMLTELQLDEGQGDGDPAGEL
jgi:DNA modification methylase